MDDVVACLLLYIVVILYMKSSAPERFCRSWFWGVTFSRVACTLRGVRMLKTHQLPPCLYDMSCGTDDNMDVRSVE